jgi:NAD(P)-dependent dehydrogenase (short-subunit alcohol dehydrogenase family)
MLRQAVSPNEVAAPLGRLVSPEDVVACVAWLVSAEMVTGAAITLDGGTSL